MNRDRVFIVETEGQCNWLCGFMTRQELPFQATLGPVRKQRSISANRRLWALHTLASDVTGYTPEEMHEEALCAHYGYTERECRNPWTGEVETRRVPNKRSSVRNTKEFALFMEATEMLYGDKLGVWLAAGEE